VLRKNAKVELLSEVPLFAGCSKRELGLLATVADELDLAAGVTLIREGAPGREFFVVVSGTIEVERGSRKVAELGDGDWVGEIALVTDAPRTATVRTTSPVRVLVLTDRAFSKLVRDVPSIAEKVMRSLGERLAADAV
jgi:CRP-like cAMP-binding protein